MIHLFKQNGFNICLDVNSGAIHVPDDYVFEILSGCENIEDYKATRRAVYDISDDKTKQVYDEIDGLIEAGSLFSTIDIPEKTESIEKIELKALCLHMAHTCNLRCSYCFAGDGEYSGGTKLMPFDIAKKAVALLLQMSVKRKMLR